MDATLSQMAIGSIFGFCVTAILIWSQRGSPQIKQTGYFGRVVASAALTALLGGAIRTGVDFASTRVFTLTGTIFALGWLIGALLAGWFITRMLRQS